MQWLDTMLFLAAGIEFVLASLSCIWLTGYGWEPGSRARRVGAASLALVCVGMALEALLYLSLASTPVSWTRAAATVVVRAVLMTGAALIWLLLLRKGFRAR